MLNNPILRDHEIWSYLERGGYCFCHPEYSIFKDVFGCENEHWSTKESHVLTFDTSGWSLNISFTVDGKFIFDSIEIYSPHLLNDDMKFFQGKQHLVNFVQKRKNIDQFLLYEKFDELVLLSTSSQATAHYSIEKDSLILKKISGKHPKHNQIHLFDKMLGTPMVI